jgi:hypothetical protein
MLSGNKKWFYLTPLILLVYVPIKIRGTDMTFWIFSLDFTRLGEKGVLWHCYAVLKCMNWQYVIYELLSAYLVLSGGIYFLKVLKGSVAKKQ